MTDRMLWMSFIAVLLICSGCVTQRVDQHDENDGESYLKQEIDKVVKRLHLESGQDLYVDLSRLIAYGSFAVEPMRNLLDHDNPQMRSSAAYVLGQLKSTEAIEDLMALLEDEDKLVRYEAARALLEIGAWKSSIPVLLGGLDDDTPNIRFLCQEILEKKLPQDFGYQYDGPKEERLEAIRKMKAWWEGQPQSDNPKDNLAAR